MNWLGWLDGIWDGWEEEAAVIGEGFFGAKSGSDPRQFKRERAIEEFRSQFEPVQVAVKAAEKAAEKAEPMERKRVREEDDIDVLCLCS